MEKYFIPYEQALELKEFGFDEPCLRFYDDDKNLRVPPMGQEWSNEILNTLRNGDINVCAAPLWEQAFEWFRNIEKFNCEITTGHDEDRIWWNYSITKIELGYNYDSIADPDRDGAETYEEARLNCLKEMIEIVLNEFKENPPFGGGNR